MAGSKLDAMAAARDYLYHPSPRKRPLSTARKLQQIERISREAHTMASVSGGSGGPAVFDTLPDPTSEDLGQVIYVNGPAGQPAAAYIGVLSQNDTVAWEPIQNLNFWGAFTEFTEEFYSDVAWTFTGASHSFVQGDATHPGAIQMNTTASIGGTASARLPGFNQIGDIDKAAFIFQTGSLTSSYEVRVGLASATTGGIGVNGLYLEKEFGDTNWFFVPANNGELTRVNSGISATPVSNWWLFQIEDTPTAGQFLCSITDLTGSLGTASGLASGIDETDDVFAFFYTESNIADVRRLVLDYYWVRHHPAVRA